MSRKILFSVLAFILIGFMLFPIIAFADDGPKPSIDINITNLETTNYLIDLFVYDADGEGYKSLADYNGNGLTEDQINQLHELNFDGWISESTRWNEYLLFADCAGNADHRHTFSYFGTPERYKIVIINNDTGETKISDEITRKDFNSVITIDYDTMNTSPDSMSSTVMVPDDIEIEPTISKDSNWKKTIIASVIALIFTIGIELLIAFAFKTKNYIAILITNFVTNASLQAALIFIPGNYLAIFIVSEVIVILTELAVYLLSFKNVGKLKTILYTLAANAVTAILLFLLHKI